MLWFLTQEVAGEAGFDDLLALTQVKMPITAKLEMARNYWDEMGRGRETAMHWPTARKASRTISKSMPSLTGWCLNPLRSATQCWPWRAAAAIAFSRSARSA
jgi:hypothetical protein